MEKVIRPLIVRSTEIENLLRWSKMKQEKLERSACSTEFRVWKNLQN